MATNRKKSNEPSNNFVQAPASNSKLAASEKEYGTAIKMFAVAEKQNAYSGYEKKIRAV